MKFETRSGCKLLSISLCDERKYLGVSLSLSATEALVPWPGSGSGDTMFGPIGKLIGPAKTRLQRYVEEASSLPSSTVEEKIASRREVIARINTNVSLLD